MDIDKPFIGYRSPRRAERNNDRVAASNAPLAAIRGWAAGTAGLPGDLEGLVRMLPGIERKEPVLPTSDFYKEWLPLRGDSPTERAFTEAGSLFGGAGATNVARALKTGASAGSRGALSVIQTAAKNAAVPRQLNPQAGVVKMKGGNWLTGSVEEELKPFRVTRGNGRTPEELMADMRAKYTPEAMEQLSPQSLNAVNRAFAELEPQVAINQWIDKKLARYVKNEMGTPEDPIRALMLRNVSHVPRREMIDAGTFVPDELVYMREEAGFPGMGFVEDSLKGKLYGELTDAEKAAIGWEASSDVVISPTKAGEYVRNDLTHADILKKNPWLTKVDPDTPVYSPYFQDSSLGFDHLIDELKNATNPNSGLPPELLWKYSDLDKVTVPQAVQRVSDINDWRVSNKAKVDQVRANNAATQLFKEYPDAGYRWVELKTPQPDMTGLKSEYVPEVDMWRIVDKNEGVMGSGDTEIEALKSLKLQDRKKALEDALKYEGDTMGHCVGGYCDEVASGQSRIYSLRDKKGQPHTTIEITPGKSWNERSGVFYDNPELEPPWIEFHNAMLDRGGASPNIKKFPEWLASNRPEVFSKYEKVFSPDPDRIVQIKGKQNMAPNPEYLPFVQDFVKSGNWSDVGDLRNAGLVEYTKRQQHVPQGLTGRTTMGVPFDEVGIPEGYYTEPELLDLMRGWQNRTGNTPGYARGGLVTYDSADIDDRVLQLMSELEAEGA